MPPKNTFCARALMFGCQAIVGLMAFVGMSTINVEAKDSHQSIWDAAVKLRDPSEIIRMFDENNDGKIDRIEYRVKIVQIFVKFDENRDDHLTPNEIPGLSKSAFQQADKDQDGKISTYEFVTADPLKFEVVDANGDGFITSDEVKSHQKKAN